MRVRFRALAGLLVAAAVGGSLGWAAPSMLLDAPTETIAAPSPVAGQSPAVPSSPPLPYAADIDYPTLRTDLRYERQTLGSAPYEWSFGVPRGWTSRLIGPAEATWAPPGAPVGSYGLRVKIVSERRSTEDMVADQLRDMRKVVADVQVRGRTDDTLAVTFRGEPSNRLRLNTFRWFTGADGAAAQLEVSVNGRRQDAPGLSDLLDQLSASTRAPQDP